MGAAAAGVIDAAKGQVQLGVLLHAQIEADAAGAGAGDDSLLDVAVATPEIERQGLGPGVDALQHLFQVVVGDHRQERTEQLLAVQGAVDGRAIQQGRGEIAPGHIVRAAMDQLRTGGLGLFQQSDQLAGVALVDESGIVRAGRGIAAVALHQQGATALLEGRQQAAGDEDMIGRHAGLAGIEEFAPEQQLGGGVQVGAGVDDRRRLAAQLQGHRGQVPGSGLHHQAAHGGGAGKEEVVEGQRQQCLGGGDVAFAKGHGVRGEGLGQQFAQHRIDRRGEFRGLEHHAVASRQGRHQGAEQGGDRVVPGADDQAAPARLAVDVRRAA